MSVRILLALPALSLVACGGDITSATGALGRVTYALHADYEIDGKLDEVPIVTGHWQPLMIDLTRDGERKADDMSLITHHLEPAGAGEVEFYRAQDEDSAPPDVDILIHEAGTYTIETRYDGEQFDYIELRFEKPGRIETTTWLRPPDAEDFERSTDNETISVVEGAQSATVAIPYKGSERLVGNYELEWSHSPREAAVRVYNVVDVYEEEAPAGYLNEESLVFIEPATVTLTATDGPNGISVDRVFEVSAAE